MLTWPDVVLGLFDYPGLNSGFILLPRQVVRAAEEEVGSWHLEHDTLINYLLKSAKKCMEAIDLIDDKRIFKSLRSYQRFSTELYNRFLNLKSLT